MLGASAARAQSREVVLVLAPVELYGRSRELSVRIDGELRAAGFDVVHLPLEAGQSARAAAENAGHELHPTVGLALEESAGVLRVWMSDRHSLRMASAEWRGEDTRAARLVAVQGVEFVRAGLASQALERVPAPPALRDGPEPSLGPSPSPRASLGAHAGVGCLLDPGSGVISYMPLARLTWLAPFTLGESTFGAGLRVTGAGFGSQGEFSAAGGSARVRQDYVLADVTFALAPGALASPFISAGGGWYGVDVSGTAEPGFYAQSKRSGSALGSAGLGLMTQPLPHLTWSLEGQALFAAEPAAVRIGGAPVTTLGRPAVSFSTAVGVSL
jgi:hypothetical protein